MNWEYWWPGFPVLVYFKVRPSREGGVAGGWAGVTDGWAGWRGVGGWGRGLGWPAGGPG